MSRRSGAQFVHQFAWGRRYTRAASRARTSSTSCRCKITRSALSRLLSAGCGRPEKLFFAFVVVFDQHEVVLFCASSSNACRRSIGMVGRGRALMARRHVDVVALGEQVRVLDGGARPPSSTGSGNQLRIAVLEDIARRPG